MTRAVLVYCVFCKKSIQTIIERSTFPADANGRQANPNVTNVFWLVHIFLLVQLGIFECMMKWFNLLKLKQLTLANILKLPRFRKHHKTS